MPFWQPGGGSGSGSTSPSRREGSTTPSAPVTLYTASSTDKAKEIGAIPPPFPLPFFRLVELPKGPEGMTPVQPPNAQENCVGKSMLGGITGAGLGVLMGVFLGAMGDMSPAISIINGREAPQAPAMEQMRIAYKATFERCGHWARNFGVLTALFGGVDCVVEKWRGKHDAYNGVISGCGVGAALSARGGPQAACLGCVGFAAFSVAMEALMGGH